MTREEAIAWLRERGIGATTRDELYGPCILVYDKEESGALIGMVHLYRDQRDPEAWVLDFLYTPGPYVTRHSTLLDACEAARRHIETQRAKKGRR